MKEEFVEILARLSKTLPFFEDRKEQKEMMMAVWHAFEKRHIALIEAGTGTGKSFSYLLPAILWGFETQEKTVIATHTIPLQEQLLKKDIPFLQKAIGRKVNAVLLKGMKNYLCLKKLQDVKLESLFLEDKEKKELELLDAFAEKSQDGSRSSLPMVPSKETWEKVAAEQDSCYFQKCPFYSDCFFFQAKKRASEADLFIVNHHLLFSDLVKKKISGDYEKPSVIPPYHRIILDEAHHLDQVAADFFASSYSKKNLIPLLAKLMTEKSKFKQGKLVQLQEKLKKEALKKDPEMDLKPLLEKFILEIPSFTKNIFQTMTLFFQRLQEFLQNKKGTKLRLFVEDFQSTKWQLEILPEGFKFVSDILAYTTSLEGIQKEITVKTFSSFKEQVEGILYEVMSLKDRLKEYALSLKRLLENPLCSSSVRWLEENQENMRNEITLFDAELETSSHLRETLFLPFSSVVLCSATLTSEKNFSYTRKKFGLEEENLKHKQVKEHIFDSPFPYQKQVFFSLPTDFPPPDHPNFCKKASSFLEELLVLCKGSALLLFTSYQMMETFYQNLHLFLEKKGYPVLKQGQASRHSLLEKFRQKKGSILFATHSFWEGIDVQGDALHCVVIVKLPFLVPKEPFIEAKMERLEEEGLSSFWHYLVPHAALKFKQGFGRLIRKKDDYGSIICLDVRLMTKSYGKVFLDSLPPCSLFGADGKTVLAQVKNFYESRKIT